MSVSYVGGCTSLIVSQSFGCENILMAGNERDVHCLAFYGSGSLIAIASHDQSACVWISGQLSFLLLEKYPITGSMVFFVFSLAQCLVDVERDQVK